MESSSEIRIVIVEDDIIIAKDIELTLNKLGYRVVGHFINGKNVLKEIPELKPDIVLMDIMLEGEENGIEIARQIHDIYKIPVIFLTALSDKFTISQAKSSGTFGYILKPFDEKALFTTIEMALYKSQVENRILESKKKIENLHTTARKLSKCKTRSDVFGIVEKSAAFIIDFMFCAIFVYKDTELEIINESAEYFLKNNSELKSMNYELAIQTMSTTKTIVQNRYNDICRSVISIPIDKIGVFQFFSEKNNAFTAEDVNILELLIGHTKEALNRIVMQNKLEEQAVHDSLTGLFNRYYLRQAIEFEKKLSVRYKHSIAFLMFYLNDFKLINDKYGHKVGDEVLVHFADFLKTQARDADIVVRYGGDEFLIMLPQSGSEVEIVLRRYKKNLKEWNKSLKIYPFEIKCAIGASYWDNTGSIDEVIWQADDNMYSDKETNKTGKD